MTPEQMNPPGIHREAEDQSLKKYRDLAARVDAGEHDAILARWEFGRELLKERVRIRGQMGVPKDRMDRICTEVGKSVSTVKYWVQLAEMFPEERDCANALAQYKTWRSVVKELLPGHEPGSLTEPRPIILGGVELEPGTPPYELAMAIRLFRNKQAKAIKHMPADLPPTVQRELVNLMVEITRDWGLEPEEGRLPAWKQVASRKTVKRGPTEREDFEYKAEEEERRHRANLDRSEGEAITD